MLALVVQPDFRKDQNLVKTVLDHGSAVCVAVPGSQCAADAPTPRQFRP